MANVDRIAIDVRGRPAPQGSKRRGSAGQLREQSVYLLAWRAAVKRAAYEEYLRLSVAKEELPLFRGPVRVARCAFTLPRGRRVDSPPDVDKLLRATLDALTSARMYEDDGRVVTVRELSKVLGDEPGVELVIERAEAEA